MMPRGTGAQIIIKSNPPLPFTATRQAHQVLVMVSVRVLIEYALHGNEISATKCIKGIPPEAYFVGAIVRDMSFALIFEHESFVEVRVGSPIPIFELEFEEI